MAEISIENLGGHKLPTAYPSRRVWLHLTVRDSRGNALFESGALHPDGSIEGNDNDEKQQLGKQRKKKGLATDFLGESARHSQGIAKP